jgi:uncharacterized protein with HEPN domain
MALERDERRCLSEMLSAIDRALAYTTEGRQAFFAETRTQDAVIRNLAVLGEAMRGVSEATRQAHPEIPWSTLDGTRDRIIPGHLRVDLELVWDIVHEEFPRLRHQIAELLPVVRG